ncbi:MAG: metal ABC transporter substrate-binding protein, partial [Eubacteriales bacterium]
NKCDVFIYVGGESDAWVDTILSSVNNPDMRVIKLIDCTEELYYEEHKEGMEGHDHEDAEDEAYDEHVWTNPRNAAIICERIRDVLCEIDKDNASSYISNADGYISELEKLDAKFKDIVTNAKRREIIFADRFPLLYFVKAYGLDYYAAFPGCAGETEPSAATVAFLINKVKDDKIPVVFCLELSNGRIADTICENTGAEKLVFNACHNISKADFERGVTYIELMQKNADSLQKALG